MVGGVHQNVNGSHGLTTPLSGMVCHARASSCYDHPYLPRLNSISTHYRGTKIMKGDIKCRKWGALEQLGSQKVTGNSTIRFSEKREFLLASIATMSLSCTVSEI